MTDIRTQIIAALKKLGPSAPRTIFDAVGGSEGTFKHALRTMVKAGDLVATGSTVSRTCMLPGQKPSETVNAPPQRRKKTRPAGRKTAKQKRQAPRAQAAVARSFIAAITARREIVLFDGTLAPRVLTRDESREVADLVLDNYDPT